MENPEDNKAEKNQPKTADVALDGDMQEDSLDDWIDRAKRAHELVDAVDLAKVVEHDQAELAKVKTVTSALSDLSEGRATEHVDGVDEIESSNSEDQQRIALMVSEIANAGWAERMGRVLRVDGAERSYQPLELIPHRDGLPEFDLCIAPELRPNNGNYAIFITESGLFAASIFEPTTKYHWRIDRSHPYDSTDELLRGIKQFSELND